MISQNKKKIYIIGINSSDFLDCTFQAIKKIENSDSILLSNLFGKEFLKMVLEHNHSVFYEEDMSSMSPTHLWKDMLRLFEKNRIVSHLIDGDPCLDGRGIEEQRFFLSKKIDCELIPGIITVVNFLNQNLDLLTDREINSSATFLKDFSKKKVSKMIERERFEKLLVCLKNEKELNHVFELSEKNHLKKKLFSVY